MKNYFILKTINSDEYIGIDKISGGYPFVTRHLPSAHIFTTYSAAINYNTMGIIAELKMIVLTDVPVPIKEC